MNKSILSILMLVVIGSLFGACSSDLDSESDEMSDDSVVPTDESETTKIVEDIFEEEVTEEDVELGELI